MPFLRPKNLATDTSVDFEFLEHALKFIQEKESLEPIIFVVLRATHPIRRVETVDDAIRMYKNNLHYDSLRSVKLASQTPYKMWSISKDKEIMLKPIVERKENVELYNRPRQLLPEVYWQDGYIDVVKSDTIKNKKSSTGDFILPYITNEQTVDIDYLDELEQAKEYLIKKNSNNKNKNGKRYSS